MPKINLNQSRSGQNSIEQQKKTVLNWKFNNSIKDRQSYLNYENLKILYCTFFSGFYFKFAIIQYSLRNTQNEGKRAQQKKN